MVSWDMTRVVCRHSSTFEWNLAVELHGFMTHKTAIFIPLQESYYKRCLSPYKGRNRKRNNVESNRCNYANDLEEQHRQRGVVTPFILVVRVAPAAMQNELVSSMSCTMPAHQEAPCPLQNVGKMWPTVRGIIFVFL